MRASNDDYVFVVMIDRWKIDFINAYVVVVYDVATTFTTLYLAS